MRVTSSLASSGSRPLTGARPLGLKLLALAPRECQPRSSRRCSPKVKPLRADFRRPAMPPDLQAPGAGLARTAWDGAGEGGQMKFVGKVWKLLVGIKDGLVLIFMLIFFALVYGAMTARPTLGAGDKGALLIALDGPVVEQPAQATAAQVLGGSGGPREYRVRDLVHALDAAAHDDRVKAVALDLDI